MHLREFQKKICRKVKLMILFLYMLYLTMIINKPQPNISIHGTSRFKGHYKALQGCPLNKGSTVVLKKP